MVIDRWIRRHLHNQTVIQYYFRLYSVVHPQHSQTLQSPSAASRVQISESKCMKIGFNYTRNCRSDMCLYPDKSEMYYLDCSIRFNIWEQMYVYIWRMICMKSKSLYRRDFLVPKLKCIGFSLPAGKVQSFINRCTLKTLNGHFFYSAGISS